MEERRIPVTLFSDPTRKIGELRLFPGQDVPVGYVLAPSFIEGEDGKWRLL